MGKILRRLSGLKAKRPYVKRDSSKKRLSKEKSKQYSDFVRAAHNTINSLVKEGATRFNKYEVPLAWPPVLRTHVALQVGGYSA